MGKLTGTFAFDQVWPPSVERKMPWDFVPAYTFDAVCGSTAIAVTSVTARPLFSGVNAEPDMLRNNAALNRDWTAPLVVGNNGELVQPDTYAYPEPSTARPVAKSSPASPM